MQGGRGWAVEVLEKDKEASGRWRGSLTWPSTKRSLVLSGDMLKTRHKDGIRRGRQKQEDQNPGKFKNEAGSKY